MNEKPPLQSNSSIGFFDSGYGGLTVLDSVMNAMPEYDIIYLGDNARGPYGTRSYDVVYEYTLQAVKTLFSMGCNLVILACNTASAKALRTIQQKDLPNLGSGKRVLGVIRPSTELISQFTTTNHIGVLGTNGTIQSNSYVLELAKLHPKIKVYQEACPLWVPLVENNTFNTKGGEYFVQWHIENLLAQSEKMDAIILGCTHYPILLDLIQKYVPKEIQIISQGDLVAQRLVDYLQRHSNMEKSIGKTGKRKFYTSENPMTFKENAGTFLNQDIEVEHLSIGVA